MKITIEDVEKEKEPEWEYPCLGKYLGEMFTMEDSFFVLFSEAKVGIVVSENDYWELSHIKHNWTMDRFTPIEKGTKRIKIEC